MQSSRFHCACWLLVFVVLGTLLSSTHTFAGDCPQETTVGGFTLTFEGVTYNPGGTSTWSYTLVWDGIPPSLSHLTIELCAEVEVISSDPPGATVGPDGTKKAVSLLGTKTSISARATTKRRRPAVRARRRRARPCRPRP